MAGPRGCEITGNAFYPAATSMFVNIQHHVPNLTASQIDQSTQSNAATALQSAKVSEDVKGQVENLKTLVGWLETMVQGRKMAG